ncbi:S-protein 19 [Arabidopsis thaliana]|uniref:S-protein homolog n=2 Tax=Arabidopsis TaxID=3701 RepID=A0A178UWF2_ARATH|nr:Plant self-incompatibility S1 [Arabidopsis thaliana x Arabidopsis arenosa]OAO98356.1 hypothetical protein AXX17_AT4G28870 [Arabidopsis thaliana]
MSGSLAFHIIMSATFMVFFFGGLCEARGVNVDLINDIGPNVQLGLHCKSKNKDLGSQSLVSDQHWGFRASLGFWTVTLFFCHFEWENQSKWFDIFVEDRDLTCGDHCVWSIRPSGPCRLTGREKCFPWNNKY